jgi:hypothetical protein
MDGNSPRQAPELHGAPDVRRRSSVFYAFLIVKFIIFQDILQFLY